MSLMMNSILIPLIAAQLLISVLATPKCLLGLNQFPCADNDAWKDNIQCRLQGPVTTNNARSNDGYLQRVIANNNDDPRAVNVKNNARTVYNRIVSQITNEYPRWSFGQRQGKLVEWERQLNANGIAVFGTNWVTSQAPCGLATGVSTVCGDIGGADLAEVVPICP